MSDPQVAAIRRIIEAAQTLLGHAERCFPISNAAVSPFDYEFNRTAGALLADKLRLEIEPVDLGSLHQRLKALHDAAYNIGRWCRFERTADDPPDYKVEIIKRSSDNERLDDRVMPPLDAKYIRMLEGGIGELEALMREIERVRE